MGGPKINVKTVLVPWYVRDYLPRNKKTIMNIKVETIEETFEILRTIHKPGLEPAEEVWGQG